MGSIVDRIVAEAGVANLLEVLAERLSPTDLQTLMLAVYEKRSAERAAAQVLGDYERSRFFGACPLPRAAFAAWERAADAATADHFEIPHAFADGAARQLRLGCLGGASVVHTDRP